MTTFTLSFAADHPVGAGHFPGHPIVPGALLLDRVLDALAQTQGAAAAIAWEVRSAKFPAPVVPGQSVDVACTAAAGGAWRIVASVADARVLVAEARPMPEAAHEAKP